MSIAFVRAANLFLMILISSLRSQGTDNNKTEDIEICNTKVCQDSAKFLLDSMDASIDPCDDFYRYACGGWIDKHPIPKGKSSYSVFKLLTDEVRREVAELLKNATNENHPKSVIDAARLFQGCIDEETRERHGLNPLRDTLNYFGGWPMINPQWTNTSYEWFKQVAAIRRAFGVQAIISVEVDTHPSDPEHFILLREPSLGIDTDHLRNRTSESAEKNIAAYRNFIISTARLLNPNADEIALENDTDEIIEFMSDLAAEPTPVSQKGSKTPWYEELMRVIEYLVTKAHHFPLMSRKKVTISEVQGMTQNEYFKWTDFLNDILENLPQVTDQTEIEVYDLAYLKHAVEVVQNTDSRVVANYIIWTLLQQIGQHTTKDFRENKSRFTKATEEGKEQEEEKDIMDLDQTCIEQTTEFFDFAVGRLYIDKYINEEEIHEGEQLVDDVRSAFEMNFNHNDWMDFPTKQKALEKLRYMVNFVGYPAWIKIDSKLNDYYNLMDDLREDAYFESFVKVKRAAEAIQLRKWNKPIYRTEWTPYLKIIEVNAVYDFSRNSMYLPAAIFNVPIYKRGTLPALNYAGFGSFIAHEITHGFDSEGHKYDKEGKEVDWWSSETKKKFVEKADCIKNQYAQVVEPMTNASLHSENTLPDDIADNGAARNAFMAYEMQMLQAEEKQKNGQNMRLPGLSLTQEQLYFLGLATVECEHHTNRSMKRTIETDSHSPSQYRVRLPLRNSRAFAEAFNCPLGSYMNPEKKCELW